MSSPLAIAAVTASLKDLLNDGLMDHDLSTVGSFTVSAVPPDRITTGQNEPNQLNLFLYQVTPNPGWRNAGLPTVNGSGQRVGSAPLALDLHYLLTAYGEKDFNAEVLLGYAMHLLHETPVLTRAQLRTVLAAPDPVTGALLPSLFGSLSADDLADQVELIKITPVYLSTEELSKLWTAMQARYRPTMGYIVSVVLIQSKKGERVAPPVLKQGRQDRGPTAITTLPPTLDALRPAASDSLPALRLGDDVAVTGTRLDGQGTLTVVFENTLLGIRREFVPLPDKTSATSLTVHLPTTAEDVAAMSAWAPGAYLASLRVVRPDLPDFASGGVPVALAPQITVAPLAAPAGDLDLTLTCTPRLRPDQEKNARLIFGTRQLAPATVDTPADATQPTTLTFKVPAVSAGAYLVRLRVDGIDSLPVTLTGSPAKLDFDPQQKVTVA